MCRLPLTRLHPYGVTSPEPVGPLRPVKVPRLYCRMYRWMCRQAVSWRLLGQVGAARYSRYRRLLKLDFVVERDCRADGQIPPNYRGWENHFQWRAFERYSACICYSRGLVAAYFTLLSTSYLIDVAALTVRETLK